MKYVLTNIKLRKVEGDASKRNVGELFVQATVVNPDDLWDDDAQMTTFNPRLVQEFNKYFSPSVKDEKTDQFGQDIWKPSMLKDENKPCPENLLVFNHAALEQYFFPGGARVATDAEGNVRLIDNKPIIKQSIWVLTKKTVDNETGETRYAKGWSPSEQGESIMNHFWRIPLNQYEGQTQPMGVVLPMNPGTPLTPPLTNGETATPAGATPTATPTV